MPKDNIFKKKDFDQHVLSINLPPFLEPKHRNNIPYYFFQIEYEPEEDKKKTLSKSVSRRSGQLMLCTLNFHIANAWLSVLEWMTTVVPILDCSSQHE
jgi:hypothetical protein